MVFIEQVTFVRSLTFLNSEKLHFSAEVSVKNKPRYRSPRAQTGDVDDKVNFIILSGRHFGRC